MQNSFRVGLTVNCILHSLVPVDQGWVDGLYINQSIPVPRFRLFICRSEGEGAGHHWPAPSWFPSREPGGRRLDQGPRRFSAPLHLGQGLGLLEDGTDVGEPERLVPDGLVGPAAVGVFAGEDAGLLVTEGAGAGGEFQEVGEGNRNFCALGLLEI